MHTRFYFLLAFITLLFTCVPAQLSAQLIVDAEDAYVVTTGSTSNTGRGSLRDNGRVIEIHRGGDYSRDIGNFTDLFQWITNANRAGGHAVGLKCGPSSRPGNGNQRNEYVIYKDQPVPRGTKKYTGFSFQLKAGEWSNPDDWFVPWQWKQAPNSTAESQAHGNFPLVTLYFEEDGSNRMYFHTRYGDYGWTDTNKPRGRKKTMETIQVGVWYDVVVGMKFDADGTTGWAYAWIKRANESNYRQYGWKDIQLGYKKQPRVMDWNKFGIYRGASSKTNTMYFDEVRYGNTFAEVKIPGSNNPGTTTSGGGSGQYIANGTYYIRSNRNGQNILSNAGTNHRAKAHNAGNFSDQKWDFTHLGNNVYTMENRRTNRYLEVPYARCGNGHPIGTWTSAGGNHQRWKAVKVGSNYQFCPLHCQSVAMDLAGGQTNAFLHTWGQNTGNQNQIWRVLPAPKSLEEPAEVRVFPNPTNGLVALDFGAEIPAGGSVTIYDVHGRLLRTVNTPQGKRLLTSVEVDLGDLARGTYVVRFVGGEVEVVRRVMRL